MNMSSLSKSIVLFAISMLICGACYAEEKSYQKGRELQREGKLDEAISIFKDYISQPLPEEDFTDRQLVCYTDALVQLMNAFQSKGEPDSCILTLRELYKVSPILQKQCLRDFHSVMGYALSRTERMKEAEESMLKALALPLYHATPERYFRDYAYAAAVFYSNTSYRDEVISWCQEALSQAELCENSSGKQWVTAMLGSLYKRNGFLNKALELFQQSKIEAQERNDELGILNSLHALIDMFLYWNVPEYANIYASEAIRVEEAMEEKNPMVSAQAYINKGRALLQLGETDSVLLYTERARKICQSLPYNSGMVDVNLLHGTLLTENGGDSLESGIDELQQVTRLATDVNRARAYHQLAQTYLKTGQVENAEMMLDSMLTLLTLGDSPIYIDLNYDAILNHYLDVKNQERVEQYARLMLQEQRAVDNATLNYNLVECIVDLQTEQKKQELQIARLKAVNNRLVLLICIAISVILIAGIVLYLIKQKRKHKSQMKQANERLHSLTERIKQLNAEEGMRAQEIQEFLRNKDNRQELETLTPTILQAEGESKFRQYFELLHPRFLPRLREKVPSIKPREELLSMLIVLKLDNKRIAEIMAIAPRSVLMLRHRFRQKIGMSTEYSLENFIADLLEANNSVSSESESSKT